MRETTYVTTEKNGSAYAERVASKYRPGGEYYKPGTEVRVEKSNISNWGGNGTEAGYRITVSPKK